MKLNMQHCIICLYSTMGSSPPASVRIPLTPRTCDLAQFSKPLCLSETFMPPESGDNSSNYCKGCCKYLIYVRYLKT